MIKIKYFIQFILILFLFSLFKIIGINISSKLSAQLFLLLGPFFRSKKIFQKNIKKVFPEIKSDQENKMFKDMWRNYGKIFAEYMFMKDFRYSKKFEEKLIIENLSIFEKIKKK